MRLLLPVLPAPLPAHSTPSRMPLEEDRHLHLTSLIESLARRWGDFDKMQISSDGRVCLTFKSCRDIIHYATIDKLVEDLYQPKAN